MPSFISKVKKNSKVEPGIHFIILSMKKLPVDKKEITSCFTKRPCAGEQYPCYFKGTESAGI